MKRIPSMYNTELVDKLLSLSTRSDKFGNIYHYVEYQDTDGRQHYARFNNFASALDFISSNFK